MEQRESTKQWLAQAVLALAGVGWLFGTPYLMFGAIVTSAPFFGEPRTDEQMQQATAFLVGGLLCAFALPVLGIIVAALAKSSVALWMFVGALALSLIVLAMVAPGFT